MRHMGAMETASTHPDKFEQARFFYARVEDGLAAALGIDAAWRMLFRSRIKHYQRLGIAGERPGKGSPLKYSFYQAADLAIVLMLADLGLAPTICVELVHKHERMLRRRIRQAVGPDSRDGENPWFLALRMTAMRGPWAKQPAVAAIGAFQRKWRRPPLSEAAKERQKARLPEALYEPWLKLWDTPEEGAKMLFDHPEDMNFCVFALSHVLHRLQDYLDPNGEPPDVAPRHGPVDSGNE
jgi:hypothetical protein